MYIYIHNNIDIYEANILQINKCLGYIKILSIYFYKTKEN